MGDSPNHVVLGTGPLGASVVRALRGQGESVRAVNRSGEAELSDEVEVVAADLSETDAARRACEGASVVYFCVNPPYGKWPELFPPLLDNAIEGAESAGARLVVGDNCYMYGPVDGPLTEDLPYEATGSKGRTRATMAETAIEAHDEGRVEVAIGRGSDFFGPGVTQSMMGERVFPNAIEGDTVNFIGDPDALHTYTYIRDFGRALVTLGTEDAAVGEAWHVPSAETLTTREFLERVFEVAGTEPKIRRMPSWLFRILSTVSADLRELRETRYQFEEPFVVDHSKFEDAFGADPTPHEEAIERTLEWYRS
jgi:nucleoside-diphosphate-sugar epimerase